MQLRIDPPLAQWRPGPTARRSADPDSLRSLIAAVNERAERLGTGRIDTTADNTVPALYATGHQAFPWHPGILAKDLALHAAAEPSGAVPLHVLVDQDVHEAWRVEIPQADGDRLKAVAERLAVTVGAVPTGRQPALASIDPLGVEAFDDAVADTLRNTQPRTLAEQAGVVVERWRRPLVGRPTPMTTASDLAALPAFAALVNDMLRDPASCAEDYNAAVKAVPEAGMSALRIAEGRIELPLWSAPWREPRRKVFAVRDGATEAWRLTTPAGDEADRADLLPRALTMTGLLRSAFVDLFVHGAGGAVYSQATDRWWRAWRGETLAPVVTASADLRLSFDVPVASPDDLAHARWRARHLPHNLDRVLGLSGEDADRKRWVLDHMGDDRDRARRRRLFRELHDINARFAEQHADVLQQAQRDLAYAETGVGNHAVAQRRDWCLALYPSEQLTALRDAVRSERGVGPSTGPAVSATAGSLPSAADA